MGARPGAPHHGRRRVRCAADHSPAPPHLVTFRAFSTTDTDGVTPANQLLGCWSARPEGAARGASGDRSQGLPGEAGRPEQSGPRARIRTRGDRPRTAVRNWFTQVFPKVG